MLTTFLPYDLNCLVFTHFYGSTRTLNEMMESDNLAFANLYYLHSIKEFSRLAYLSFCRFVHLFLHFCDCLTWPNRCFYHTQKNRSEVDVLYSSFMDSLILYAHTKKIVSSIVCVNVRHSIRRKINRSMFTNKKSNCSLVLGIILFSGFNLANIGTSCSVLNEIVYTNCWTSAN